MNFNQKLIFSLFLVLLLSLIATSPPLDPDFGWHFKYGEHIIQNLSIPRNNIFSYTFSYYQWANSYWLSEVMIYLLFSKLGTLGSNLVLSFFIFSFAILVILKDRAYITQLVTSLSLVVIMSSFLVSTRPLYFSTFFMLFLLYALIEQKKHYILLPLLFLLWANMHTDFLLGLFVFGLYSLEKVVLSFKKNAPESKYFTKNTSLMVLSLFLSTAITLINPYGIELFITLFKELNSANFGFVSEMSALRLSGNFWESVHFFFWTALNIAAIYKMRNSFGRWYLLSAVFFFFLGLRAHYFFRVFYLFALFSIKNVTEEILSQKELFKKRYLQDGQKYFLPLILIILSLLATSRAIKTANTGPNLERSVYPFQAADFIKNNPQSGNMLNEYNWGGYLIWQLPEYKTFIDGRMASWRDEEGNFALRDYYQIVFVDQGNDEVFEKYISQYSITWTIFHKDALINKYLASHKNWEKIYSDDIASVYAKK